MLFIHYFKLRQASLLLACFPLYSSASINYLNIEKIATEVTCQREPSNCVNHITAAKNNTSIFKVDGISLPLDSLRDIEQQRDMISSGLYIDKSGEVKPLPAKSEVQAQNNEFQQLIDKQKKSLPIKRFPAPTISNAQNPIIIKINK